MNSKFLLHNFKAAKLQDVIERAILCNPVTTPPTSLVSRFVSSFLTAEKLEMLFGDGRQVDKAIKALKGLIEILTMQTLCFIMQSNYYFFLF
jgi:hypothetical protein